MIIDTSLIAQILVDKWYQITPNTIKLEATKFHDESYEDDYWLSFKHDNEKYMFPLSEIKGIKYNG